MKNVLSGFKEFIARGNAVELAVGVVIGAAFGTLVTSIVKGFIDPLIAMIFGKTDLSNTMTFTLNNADFSIGLILQGIINFLCVAVAVYFFIVLPLNALRRRRKAGLEAPAPPSDEILLLAEIRNLLAAQNAGGAAGNRPPAPPAY